MDRTAPLTVVRITADRAAASPASSASQSRIGAHEHIGQQTGAVQRGLRQDEQRRVAEMLLLQHLAQVRGDLVVGARRHPVEHDRDHGAPVAGRAQHAPRHRVGISRRGRHEQPQIGGGQQLVGQVPVRVHDRVDVRRVQQREARASAPAPRSLANALSRLP